MSTPESALESHVLEPGSLTEHKTLLENAERLELAAGADAGAAAHGAGGKGGELREVELEEGEKGVKGEGRGGRGCCPSRKNAVSAAKVIFWGVGTALLLLCVYLIERSLLYGHGRLYKDEDKLTAPLVFSSTAVVVVALMGLMGCVGERIEACCFQLAFRLLAVLLLMLFIACAALGARDCYEYSADLVHGLHPAMLHKLHKYGGKHAVEVSVNLVQSDLRCCGVDNYTDWESTAWYRNQTESNIKYPESCCVQFNCTYTENDGQLYTQGCFPVLRETFDTRQRVIALAATLAVICLTVSMILCFAKLMDRLDAAYEEEYEPLIHSEEEERPRRTGLLQYLKEGGLAPRTHYHRTAWSVCERSE